MGRRIKFYHDIYIIIYQSFTMAFMIYSFRFYTPYRPKNALNAKYNSASGKIML